MLNYLSAYRGLVGKPEGKKIHLEALCVDGGIILKLIFKKCGGKAWTDLVEDRYWWPACVNAVMNIWAA